MPDCSGNPSVVVSMEATGSAAGDYRLYPAAEGLGCCAGCANRIRALKMVYGDAYDVQCKANPLFHRAQERCKAFVRLIVIDQSPSAQLREAA